MDVKGADINGFLGRIRNISLLFVRNAKAHTGIFLERIILNLRGVKMEKNKEKFLILGFNALIFLLTILVFTNSIYAIEFAVGDSNESVQASYLINDANLCVENMVARGIGINRVGEILNETLQAYSAQVALEVQGRTANYKNINDKMIEVCSIKENAFKAQDELFVFNDSYSKTSTQINLSGMDKEYDDVIKSFNEERFEDTISLIDTAYDKLSELQASQTALKMFYSATTRNLKQFFEENWKSLSIGIITFTILLIIFWRAIKRYVLKHKLNNLNLRRKSIEALIKKTQIAYFKTKIMSETEFRVKINTFKEMIRSIDAKIPEIRAALIKVDAEHLFKVDKSDVNKKEGKVYKRR